MIFSQPTFNTTAEVTWKHQSCDLLTQHQWRRLEVNPISRLSPLWCQNHVIQPFHMFISQSPENIRISIYDQNRFFVTICFTPSQMHLMYSDISQIQELQFLVKSFIQQLRDFVNFGRRVLHIRIYVKYTTLCSQTSPLNIKSQFRC